MNKKTETRTTDLHLLLSEKYMAYKDLQERCIIDIQQKGKLSRVAW